jgi:hypothetical protein
MVLARKTAEVPLFETYPQQSDYVPRWKGAGDPSSRRRPLEVRLRRSLLEALPALARFLENFHWSSWLNKRCSFRNRNAYRRVKR